ncbi:MAG: WG repeat-containing protein [Eubacteriales bacterium]
MKKAILIAGLVAVLGISGVFSYGTTDQVNWLQAEKAEFLDEGSDFVIYTRGDHGEGVLDIQGKDMIKYGQYSLVEESEGFFRTSGKNIFYDEENKNSHPKVHNIFYKGSTIFPTDEYEYMSVVKEGMIFAQKNGKLGFLKSNGKVAVDFKYDYAEDFNKGVAVVGLLNNENIMYGVIDKSGKVIVPLKYNYVSKMNEGYYLFAKEIGGLLKYGLLDISGKEVISAKYDGMFLLEGKNMIVMLKDGSKKKFGIIDVNDKIVLKIEYDFIGALSDGAYLIGKDNKFGYADVNGKDIAKLNFDAAMDFSEGIAAVEKSGKWGYIDKSGKEIISFKFDEASQFRDGYAIVKLGEKYAIIDRNGKSVLNAIYDGIIRKKDGNYILTAGNRFTLMDKALHTVLSDYDYINSANNNYLVKKADKYGIIWNKAPNYQNTSIILSKFDMEINGTFVQNNAYLINGSNYIRLRDMAFFMKNTGAKFSVDYTDELKRIDIEKNKDYQGDKLTTIKEFGAGDSFCKSNAELYVDGKIYNLDSYNINGNNYYKLRDLGTVLGFSVDWNEVNKRVLIEAR